MLDLRILHSWLGSQPLPIITSVFEATTFMPSFLMEQFTLQIKTGGVSHPINNILMCNTSSIQLVYCSTKYTQICPWLHQCNADDCCYHLGLFQGQTMEALTSTMLVLLAVGVSFSNFAGLSAGIYKIPLLMAMLNLSSSRANYFMYPIVLGAGLANFILLIARNLKHPYRVGSVIDYKLVFILIPCMCVGSTVGVFGVNFVPLMIQDIIQILFFVVFTAFFFWRWATYKPVKENESDNENSIMMEMVETNSNSQRPSSYLTKQSYQSYKQRHVDIVMYESGRHVREIIMSFVVFTAFQVVSMLVLGVFIQYPPDYVGWMVGAITVFVVGFVIYLCCTFIHFKGKLKEYAKIKYKYDIELDNPYKFLIVVAGGVIGGFFQGLLGIGAGDCMISSLLLLKIHPKVASATVGYQYVFLGLADTILSMAQKNLDWQDAILFFGVSFVFGGLLTGVVYFLFWRKQSASKIVLLLVGILSLLNVIGIIPNMYVTEKYFYYKWTSPPFQPPK